MLVLCVELYIMLDAHTQNKSCQTHTETIVKAAKTHTQREREAERERYFKKLVILKQR